MTTIINTQAALHFRRIGILTIFAVYCVILMGALSGLQVQAWAALTGQRALTMDTRH